jgi:3-hydroxyacyl-CoA dehydrogenase
MSAVSAKRPSGVAARWASRTSVGIRRAYSPVTQPGDTDTTREVPEDRLSDLEREALLALIRTPATIARMEHMLETGKPLRN